MHIRLFFFFFFFFFLRFSSSFANPPFFELCDSYHSVFAKSSARSPSPETEELNATYPSAKAVFKCERESKLPRYLQRFCDPEPRIGVLSLSHQSSIVPYRLHTEVTPQPALSRVCQNSLRLDQTTAAATGNILQSLSCTASWFAA
ncbi:hypothetical protein F5Y09DRAFT_293523 [Xylaria sp. FL1042]|nr:hypothetical protein F5Y09DRAFT_293206 [Xylaria sp. FL1042]KAI0435410.1 hypothetical protein F5Y09DRAFT_293523 [Xylaria sp. FL1042]